MNICFDKFISENGVYRTQSLFIEYKRADSNINHYPYTLKERDSKRTNAISMYRIYMECGTEYEAAIKLLNSWKHWEILCEAPCFKAHIKRWREEREIREAALGKSVLIKAAEEGNTTAARALIDLSGKRKPGRPSKIEIESERKRQAAIDNKVTSIIDRMANK